MVFVTSTQEIVQGALKPATLSIVFPHPTEKLSWYSAVSDHAASMLALGVLVGLNAVVAMLALNFLLEKRNFREDHGA